MNQYIIEGGHPLYGEVEVSGSKNAVLPIIAASILNKGTVEIHNCPKIHDVTTMLKILSKLGCIIKREKQVVTIHAQTISSCKIPKDLMHEMRSSVMMAGALLGRTGCARFTYPGGCEIGARPINMHLEAFQKMGVAIIEDEEDIECQAHQLHGEVIHLNFPSVGATENIMLASVLAEGTTYIQNAAREPEIQSLQDFLNSMGAQIVGAGGSTIVINGVSKLHDTVYTVIPDRIETGTYLCMVAGCGGEIHLTHANPKHLESVLEKLKQANCRVGYTKNDIFLKSSRSLYPVNIKTMPYPGFPTDMQSQFVTILSIAKGTSYVVETIFENRYKYVSELKKMGANIIVEGSRAMIQGSKSLKSASVEAKDLRGGAALVEAALMAEGVSTIRGIQYIQRGYENLIEKLAILGAKIKEE